MESLSVYRLESHPTNPPKPMAIWDVRDGMPGSGARLVADVRGAKIDEAQVMLAALIAKLDT